MSLIIQVNNLSKHFKDLQAVDQLSFSVNEGDVYGFLGQNGAGKSTTIRMLLTLIKPTGGEIKIFDRDLDTNRHYILKNTGAIIEKPDMYKYLSSYDNLSIFCRMSGIKASRKLIMEQLDVVGLASRSSSKVKTYSQGMKQRLGIAIALIHNPQLIILDEPTNGLDPQGIADMRHLILGLSKDLGKTVVVSSHLLNEIELIANRMLIINKGKSIAEGYVKDLLNPLNTVVKLETTDNSTAFSKLQTTEWAASAKNTNAQIHININKDKIPQLISKLCELDVNIIAVQPRHSLEDYFLSLTNNESDVQPFAN